MTTVWNGGSASGTNASNAIVFTSSGILATDVNNLYYDTAKLKIRVGWGIDPTTFASPWGNLPYQNNFRGALGSMVFEGDASISGNFAGFEAYYMRGTASAPAINQVGDSSRFAFNFYTDFGSGSPQIQSGASLEAYAYGLNPAKLGTLVVLRTKADNGAVDERIRVTGSEYIQVKNKLYPAQDTGIYQTTSAMYAGSGLPSGANGNNGDFYFRGDTPGVALQRLYVKSAGAWVGIL